MRKLIIGCGYLGRRVARLWLDRGDDVSAVTRSATTAEEFRATGITPIVADVTDSGSLAALPEVDTVLFAVGYDRNAEPSKAAVYVDGLGNVLRAMSGRGQRFIHISSTSVYGQQAGEWVDEHSPCEPVSEGGQICLQAEESLRRFSEEANILRLAGIYGPGRLLRRASQLKSQEPIGGNPNAFLNLIHVDDASTAVLACEQHGTSAATYLVSDNHPQTRRAYYETLSRLLDSPQPVFVAENEQPTILNKRCRNTRMRRELLVELVHPTMESGLRHAIDAE